MPVFNSLYASAYDLLYADKDYTGEAAFIQKLVKSHAPQARRLLDLGSGTGRHGMELMGLGYDVVGVELSAEMLAKAQLALDGMASADSGPALPEFHQGDIRHARLGSTFDVVTALFHVVSYQTTNEDLKAAMRTAAAHLPTNGIFIFDYWYGPAVLTEKPSVKIKRLQGKDVELVRIAEPTIRLNENLVEVDYEVFVSNSKGENYQSFTEHHEMRYLFLPEIQALADAEGWAVLDSGEWLTGAPPSERTWGVYTVLRKMAGHESE